MSNIDKPLYPQLTHEIITPSNRKGVTITVMATILIILLINFITFWYLKWYPGNSGYWLVEQKWNMLNALDEPVDWLILGDSSGNQGVVPEVLVGDTAVSAINLSTVASMTTVNDVWMLQTYIDSFGPPESVLIVHVHDIWSRNINHTYLAKVPMPLGSWETLTPPIKTNIAEEFHILLSRYAPIYTENTTVSKIIYESIFELEPLFEERFQLQPAGNMLFSKLSSEGLAKDVERHFYQVRKQDFKISTINQTALERLSMLAEKHQLDIYIVNSPLYDGMFRDEAFQQHYAAMQEQMHQFSSQSDYIHFLDITAVFPADDMQNVDHIAKSGAITYTEMIVDAIAHSQLEN
ncbi:MAG: hypothetical protein GY943_03205 [Chloroflexi bacterium]|nr:hypothetical protein [Chloroflexota bacterium]